MPLEISLLIMAAACIVFVITVLIAMRLFMLRLHILTEKTIELQRDLNQLAQDCSKLLQTTDDTVKEIGEAVSTVNYVVGAAKGMGQSLEQTAGVMKKISGLLSQRAAQYAEQERDKRQLEDMMQWAELAMSAWQLWQTGRQKNKQPERRE